MLLKIKNNADIKIHSNETFHKQIKTVVNANNLYKPMISFTTVVHIFIFLNK